MTMQKIFTEGGLIVCDVLTIMPKKEACEKAEGQISLQNWKDMPIVTSKIASLHGLDLSRT
jgi:hypothetical protein